MKQFFFASLFFIAAHTACAMQEQPKIAMRFDNYARKRVYCRVNNRKKFIHIFGLRKKPKIKGFGHMAPTPYYSQFLMVKPNDSLTLYAHRKSKKPLLAIPCVQQEVVIKINKNVTSCAVAGLESLTQDEYGFFQFCADYYTQKAPAQGTPLHEQTA